jgi:hypothetical protein
VLHSAGKTIIAVVLAMLLGMQWTVLQSAAWVGMLISYSQNSSWSEAFIQTFDGQHPCKLCKVVAEGKRSEKAKEMSNSSQKLEATAAEGRLSLSYPEVAEPDLSSVPVPKSILFAPPHQPPRA